MTKPYVPHDGSVVSKIIGMLKALPPGASIPTAVIKDQLGLEQVHAYCNAAIRYGLVKVERFDGIDRWSLGPVPVGQPSPPVVEDTLPPSQRTVPAPAAAVTSMPPRPPVAPKLVKKPLRIALWSDGELVIESEGETITFNPDESRQIAAYLARCAEPTE